MKPTLELEARTVRNVAEAIERSLIGLPGGASLDTIRATLIETCGVKPAQVERAIWVLTVKRHVEVEGTRISLTKEYRR